MSITFVNAGAGSGKTYRVTSIIHERIASGDVRPEAVIATTFTRKAAAELRGRIQSRLIAEGQFAEAQALLSARVGTVNSVAGELLGEFSFLAGISPRLEVMNEEAAERMLSRALGQHKGSAAGQQIAMLAARLGVESWREDVKAVIDRARANDLAPEQFAEFAEQSCRELDELLPGPVTTGTLKALEAALAWVADDPAFRDSQVKKTRAYLDLVRLSQRLIASGQHEWRLIAKLVNERPQTALSEQADKIAELAARHDRDQALRDDISGYTRAVFDVAAQAIQSFAAEKQERGLIDFIDQEHSLLKLLDEPEVIERLHESLDLLVVDEFQDTSPIQLALFVKLAGIARETCWVGDIKQAIYGFRGADPAFMESILAARNELGMRDETVGTSYRSRPQLVWLANALFVPAFAPGLLADQVELKPHRAEVVGDPALGVWMIEGSNVDKRAAAIAAGVRGLIESNYQVQDRETKLVRCVRYADIAILARQNVNADGLADALAALGVPVSRQRKGLLAQPECVLLTACLRRLADRADTVATAEIVSLASCTEPEQWLSSRLAHLAAGGRRSEWLEAGDEADPIVARLACLRDSARFCSPSHALDEVIAECGLVERVLQWQSDTDAARRRLANIDAYKELVATFEDERRRLDAPCTVASLIDWLDGVEGTDDDRLPMAEVDAVTVDTYHGSKGLEWPVVVMTELETGVKSSVWGASVVAGEFRATDPLDGRRLRFWPWPYGKMSKVALADVAAASEAGQQALAKATEEAKRLLYVGLTRAREHLVLAFQSGSQKRGALEVLGCDWLPGDDEEAPTLCLPNGEAVSISRRLLDGESAVEIPTPSQAAGHLNWFPERPQGTTPQPLFITPSMAESVECEFVEMVQIHEPTPVNGKPDPVALGTAVHGVLAAVLARPDDPQIEQVASRVLNAFGVEKAVDGSQLLAGANALVAWLNERWPGHELHCEYPFEISQANGQVSRGQIDLFLRCGDQIVVIDFKAMAETQRSDEELARVYSGQLERYRQALTGAESPPSACETWLMLPLAGRALRIGLTVGP